MKLNDLSSQAEVVKIIAKEKLKFMPGSKNDYSNSGYYLLGAIASKVENKPFAEVVKNRIFIPLKMVNSGFAKTGEYVQNHALPYEKKGDEIKQLKPELIGEPPSGAGSEYCSSADLYKFYSSIVNDNKLLTDTSKTLLFNHYLMGKWNDILTSEKIFGFVGGDTRGWSAKLTFMFLNNKVYGIIILANFDNMANELDQKLRPLIKNNLK
jgi:CubicO group peptidase (beta-lactamase class C family)